MSGTGGKPRSQTASTQKVKPTVARQNRTTKVESQERGKTRAAGLVEIDEGDQEVGNAEKGRAYLEEKVLLVPPRDPLTLYGLIVALFQIAALPGIGCPAINAVRTVAYLLQEVETGAIAADIRDIANEQFSEMTKDLGELMEGLKEKVLEEVGKTTVVLEKKTLELAGVVEKVAQQAVSAGSSPYRDALSRTVSRAPLDANPRLAAKENIRQRQSLIDLPRESKLRECTNTTLVGKFSEAIGRATAQKHRIRSVTKMQNGGILVEMVTDEGVAWMASKANAESFLRELGEAEASFKTRSYNVVAYYVPLNLDTNSEKDRKEIEEMNNIPEGGLAKLRWIKPPSRRRADQCFAHIIATFSDADAANQAIVNGLTICHKRVSVAKSKREPIQCLKCQGWDHVAAECSLEKEVNVCGTCAKDHWTSRKTTPAGIAAAQLSSGRLKISMRGTRPTTCLSSQRRNPGLGRHPIRPKLVGRRQQRFRSTQFRQVHREIGSDKHS
ncbi:uncharacterized protein LACBIDRAFT_327836 [Laccaria bicolor S238N-H82]|uniref:Predicted protein n=1 Tax=Laccaria bicolor (strain S238N-H82 / ATCC MYA-4686) TaxID=486041 RepID=B0DCZ6_LACBS|nr:uncharacterized protein LACBIDRAFT_327836 [Laccaria bicolor S238N-H82]EDR07384.1 predicted protein [Laccaria bicolor S238N-H82]|eukprot:XP_001881776.1 predicted protein [Laccaria bicolor S238N-H82]